MNDIITLLLPHIERLGPELVECFWQTATMVAVSGTIAWFLGVAIGVLLVTKVLTLSVRSLSSF